MSQPANRNGTYASNHTIVLALPKFEMNSGRLKGRKMQRTAASLWNFKSMTKPSNTLTFVLGRHQSSGTQLESGIAHIKEMLSNPQWSVKALLPSEEQIDAISEVTPKQLHHLLRLSALPPPATPEEEAKMLRDLKSQLYFVKEIQKVDTTGVVPLRSIRDETATAEKENEISMETLKEAFAREEVVGKHHKRIRRRKDLHLDARGAEDWDVLAQASKRVGKFFVVEGGQS